VSDRLGPKQMELGPGIHGEPGVVGGGGTGFGLDMISTNIAALTSTQHYLVVFLAKFHSEVDVENAEWEDDLSADDLGPFIQTKYE
jgi:hypothetical protein